MNTKLTIGVISMALLACATVDPGGARAKSPAAQSQQKKAPASSEKKAVAPGGGCSLLTLAMLQKVLGQSFNGDATITTKTPPAYDGAWGSGCQFFSTKSASEGGLRVDFMVYVEGSPAVAKQTFDKAAVFFTDRAKPKPSIGDSAYWQSTDDGLVIHVLKGKVHYSLSLDPANEKRLTDLAAALASRL